MGRNGPVLVGGSTDGTSVNIGVHNGMKGQMQSALPWLHWAWCYSHHLELACKDAQHQQDAFSPVLFVQEVT